MALIFAVVVLSCNQKINGKYYYQYVFAYECLNRASDKNWQDTENTGKVDDRLIN